MQWHSGTRCGFDHALCAEQLSVRQPRIVVNDTVLMILDLHNEVTVLLGPVHDEDTRTHAGNVALDNFVDIRGANGCLHAQLCR